MELNGPRQNAAGNQEQENTEDEVCNSFHFGKPPVIFTPPIWINNLGQTARKPWIDLLEATSIGARGMPKHPHKNKGLLERFVLLCKMLQQNGLQF